MLTLANFSIFIFKTFQIKNKKILYSERTSFLINSKNFHSEKK